MAVDDATLVAQAQAGDREALGELLSRHERAMLAIARAYFASEADAKDAVQEASATVCRALEQLKSGSRFSGWMARITVNTCLQILRTYKDKVSLADFASSAQVFRRVGATPLTPAALASRNEHGELLRVAIGRLSEDHRVAVMLRYDEDLSYEEIAAYLDVPLSTVKSPPPQSQTSLRRGACVAPDARTLRGTGNELRRGPGPAGRQAPGGFHARAARGASRARRRLRNLP